MKRIFYVVLVVVVMIIGIAFAAQNRQIVEISYYFGLQWRGSISVAILTTFSFGVITGYLVSLRMAVRLQRQLSQSRKEIRQIEQEVINLRALPIKDVI